MGAFTDIGPFGVYPHGRTLYARQFSRNPFGVYPDGRTLYARQFSRNKTKIGNGLLDDVSDTRGTVDFAWSHARVSEDTRDEFLLSCASGSRYEDEACSKVYETLLSEIGVRSYPALPQSASQTALKSDESDEGDAHEDAAYPEDE
nr:serine carboxypeptidase II-1 [Tanacetum cinerariifolium]